MPRTRPTRKRRLLFCAPLKPHKRHLTAPERAEYERRRAELSKRLESVQRACEESEIFTAEDMMTTVF